MELSLAELYRLLYSGKTGASWGRAIRAVSVYREPEERAALLAPEMPAITTAQRALMLNRPFRAAWERDYGEPFAWAADPTEWLARNSMKVQELKKWLERETAARRVPLSPDTKKFLRGWVNNNRGNLPRPPRETVLELRPYRPSGPVLLYRGMRFLGVETLVAFHEEYATGKPFPFTSERASSWSTSPRLAEQFARYRPSESNDAGTLNWLGRAKAKKDYDGRGGYVIAARIRPEDCLVDLAHPDLPDWGFSQHGGEGEVIVLPGRAVTSKVVMVVGDVAREVQEFLQGTYLRRRTPEEPKFWASSGAAYDYDIRTDGDSVSGTVQFTPKVPSLGAAREEVGPYILQRFTENLYRAEWVGGDTVRYWEMKFPGSAAEQAGRVAARWLRAGS